MSTTYKLYRYTGDVKLLKPAGYTFHKLYAMNYKAYNLNDVWLFVKGGLVIEIDGLKLEHWNKVIKFILDNKEKPIKFWQDIPETGYFKNTIFPQFRVIDGEIYSKSEKIKKGKTDEDFRFKDGFPLKPEFVKQIIELNKLGTLKEVEINL